MDLNSLIRFGVAWGPTIIFLLVLVCHFLVGLKRGQRKSLILAIQSFVLFMLCFTLFVFLVNIEKIDELTFEYINKILAKFNTSLDQVFGISGTTSLKGVIVKVLPNVIGYGKVLESLFTNNAAYLNTLVSLIYHLFFALVCYLIYLIIDLIAFFIYLVFYNNRRYTKKCNRLYRNNAMDTYVSKNRLGGGCIGLIKGFVSGFIILSFIGSCFFIVGGDGNRESKDISFGDKNIDIAYTAYDALGSYANTGILKVLNNIKNSDDVPYYLFAFDLVFSGKYKDEQNNINGNFVVREEMSSYINLTRDTFDLLMKYDNDDSLKKLITGQSNADMNEVLLKIFQDKGFSKEFRDVINKFEAKTYLINLTLGLVNSVLVNLDEVSVTLEPEVRQVVEILFKGENAIKVNDLVRSSDLKVILNLLLDVLSYDGDPNSPSYTVDVINVVIPSIKKLNLYNDKDLYKKLNPLLSECYAFILENTFTQLTTKQGLQQAVKETSKINIDWFNEIHIIVDNFESLYYFYNDIYCQAYIDNPSLPVINFLLDYIGDNEEYLLTTKGILKALSDSQAISYFVEYSTITDSIINSFPPNISENIPTKLSLANKYDENGNLVETGEMMSLFGAMLDIASDKTKKEAFLKLINFDMSTDLNALGTIFNAFDTNFLNRISSSKLLNYAITGLLESIPLVNDVRIYMPNTIKEVDIIDGKSYERISKEVFADTLNKVPSIIDMVGKYFNAEFTPEIFDQILNDYQFQQVVLTNDIFEATIANVLISVLESYKGQLILVDNLKNPENWLAGEGEIKCLLDAIRATGVKMNDILNGNLDISMIKNWNIYGDNVHTLLKSKFLRTNISYALSLVDQLVVPFSSFDETTETVDNVKLYVINNEQLAELISLIPSLFDFYDSTLRIDYIISNIDTLLNKPIVEATFTYLVGNELIKNPNIYVAERYKEACTKESISTNPDNIWIKNKEAKNIVLALKTFFGYISLDNLSNIDDKFLEYTVMNMDEIITDRNNPYFGQEKIHAVMSSHIISQNVSKILDNVFTDDLINAEYKAILRRNESYDTFDILNVIKALKNYLYIKSINDINITNIETFIFKDPYNVIHVYESSNIIKAIVGTQLQNTLSANVDPNLFKATSTVEGFVSADEISYLLRLFSILNITSFNDLTNVNFVDNSNLTSILKLTDVIDGSKILRGIITHELDQMFSNNSFIKPTDAAKETITNNVNHTSVMIYTGEELICLITQVIGLTNGLNDLNINSLTIDNIRGMTDSLIIRNSITQYLISIDFKIPANLAENNILTKAAINTFLTTLTKDMGINTLGDFNFSNIKFTYSLANRLSEDYLMKYSFTNILINNKLFYFTKDLVDTDVDINGNEIYGLTYSELYGLYLFLHYNSTDGTLSSIDFTNLNKDSFSKSELMINSISKMIKISGLDILVKDDLCQVKQTLDGRETYVLTSTELTNFLEATRVLSSGSTGTDIKLDISTLFKLSSIELDIITNSDIFQKAISKILPIKTGDETRIETLLSINDDKKHYTVEVLTKNAIMAKLGK